MAGFSTYPTIGQVLTAGQRFRQNFSKTGLSVATNNWMSWWFTAGNPAAGSAPASNASGGTSYNSDTTGALFFPNTSSQTKHLVSFGGQSTIAVNVMIYDRLTAVGGVSLTSISNVTAVTPALPRYTSSDARYVQPWFEISTAVSGSSATVDLRYTNDSGNGSRQGDSITISTGTGVLRGMIPLPLQSGDRGIQVTASLNVSANASGNGAGAIVLLRPLGYLHLPATTWNEQDYAPWYCDLLRVYDGAQIGIAFLGTGSNTPSVDGGFTLGWN